MSVFHSATYRQLTEIATKMVYKPRLGQVGRGTRFDWRVSIHHGRQIQIGSRCWFDRGVVLDGFSLTSAPSGIHVGDDFTAREYAILEAHRGWISIGNDCFVGEHCMIYGQGGVSIGDHVMIATGTVIIPSQHLTSSLSIPMKQQGDSSKGIVIEDDVWIGANCTILDGVVLGRGCIVGAGAVVTRDVAPYSIVTGVPARFLRMREALDNGSVVA